MEAQPRTLGQSTCDPGRIFPGQPLTDFHPLSVQHLGLQPCSHRAKPASKATRGERCISSKGQISSQTLLMLSPKVLRADVLDTMVEQFF